MTQGVHAHKPRKATALTTVMRSGYVEGCLKGNIMIAAGHTAGLHRVMCAMSAVLGPDQGR